VKIVIAPCLLGERWFHEGRDRAGVSVATRTASFSLSPEGDQGALALGAEVANNRLLTVEIDRAKIIRSLFSGYSASESMISF
jgi:hypothetical protein